jgi:hypothetical protein
MTVHRLSDPRWRLRRELEEDGLISKKRHIDYGQGYHGDTFLDVPRLVLCPSRLWRLAQDLMEIVPADLRMEVDIVAGHGSVGAILAHDLAGLVDSARPMEGRRCMFVPFENDHGGKPKLSCTFSGVIREKRVLLVTEWLGAESQMRACIDHALQYDADVAAAIALWGWQEPESLNGRPVFVVCDWIVRDRRPVSECSLCRDGVAVERALPGIHRQEVKVANNERERLLPL